MTVTVRSATRGEIEGYVREMPMSLEDVQTFFGVFRGTTQYLVGFADDDLVCIWGLAPPTLASDQAYLWLYTTPALKGHEFVFVRHSQRAVEEMLKTFSSIIGHCVVGADSSIRWLRWLGAEFGYPSKGLIPFVIRSQNG